MALTHLAYWRRAAGRSAIQPWLKTNTSVIGC